MKTRVLMLGPHYYTVEYLSRGWFGVEKWRSAGGGASGHVPEIRYRAEKREDAEAYAKALAAGSPGQVVAEFGE